MTVRVSKDEQIGKRTRFRIRLHREPARRDMCLRPSGREGFEMPWRLTARGARGRRRPQRWREVAPKGPPAHTLQLRRSPQPSRRQPRPPRMPKQGEAPTSAGRRAARTRPPPSAARRRGQRSHSVAPRAAKVAGPAPAPVAACASSLPAAPPPPAVTPAPQPRAGARLFPRHRRLSRRRRSNSTAPADRLGPRRSVRPDVDGLASLRERDLDPVEVARHDHVLERARASSRTSPPA